MNQKFLIILTIITLLVGGIFLVQKSRVEKTSVPNTPESVQKQGQVKQLSQVDCNVTKDDSETKKNWRIYNNESPKFSFNYPGAWSQELVKKNDGEMNITLSDSTMQCVVEGSPALCGISLSIYPIKNSEDSVNLRYLQRLRVAEQAGQAEIKEVCVAGKKAFEITDYLRHEIIFDRDGHSFMITTNNLGSEDQNKKFWSVVDSIGSELRFE